MTIVNEINEINALIDNAEKSREELFMTIEEGKMRVELLEQQHAHEQYWNDPDLIRDDEIIGLADSLNNINYQMAELARIKEALEPRLAELLKHGDDGQKSYLAGKYKVTCKSGWIYTLNKDEYQINSGRLPKCFNFVTQRVSYDINKSVLRDAEKYASVDELGLISSMVTKKPSKLNIKITAGI